MSETIEKAILAGGCFWGMQDLIRRRPGVLATRVGYTGGDVPHATTLDTCTADGRSGRQGISRHCPATARGGCRSVVVVPAGGDADLALGHLVE
jgi:hypothetical protein